MIFHLGFKKYAMPMSEDFYALIVLRFAQSFSLVAL